MMKERLTVLFILMLAIFGSANAQGGYIPLQLSDSARISILTSAPWPQEIYAVFGHSAMRVHDPEANIDYVFNYGVFDFNSPNFSYRFMAGETDYMVIAVDYKYYAAEYEARGIDVFEQQINLSSSETQNIWTYLIENIRPENRVYRYNIFYNNCTTKLVDILEKNISGKIEYTADNRPKTFRGLIHECVYQQPWVQFGIDLIIGSKADKPITAKEKMFLPMYQKAALDKAVIATTDKKPLVVSSHLLIKGKHDETANIPSDKFSISSPLSVALILLFITLMISLLDYKKKRLIASIYDFLLFFIIGALGCIIFFMMFFSVHPCTGSNWNIVWLNPIHLIAAFLFLVKPLRKCIYYYHFINFAVLTVFLLAWSLIPQQLDVAFIPFVLTILVRSAINVLRTIKDKKKQAVTSY